MNVTVCYVLHMLTCFIIIIISTTDQSLLK